MLATTRFSLVGAVLTLAAASWLIPHDASDPAGRPPGPGNRAQPLDPGPQAPRAARWRQGEAPAQ